jgi:DNA replication and repair protein RecF
LAGTALLRERDEAAGQSARAPLCARARFRRLRLTDYRSWQALALELDGRPAVFSGANGAGKTNILEALSMFTPGRGLRGARLDEIARLGGAGGWAAAARLEVLGDERALGVGAEAGAPDRRLCRIDGSSASGPSAFADAVAMLWLTPAQDRLFVEGAAERRRFLDRMTLAHDAAHGRVAQDFETAMRQRQRLLDERSRDDAWLDALETQMAEAGVAVAAARRATAGALAAAMVGGDDRIFPAADIALEGELEAMLGHAPAAEVEDDYAARLKRNRRADTEAGRALVGPHKSDMIVTHSAKGRPGKLCSTGEQKALLIGLVLANARALALRPRAAPLVLLFDEIAAHLDEDRRAALYDILEGLSFQCFMTGTDRSLFDAWGDRAQHFIVEHGAVAEI